MAESPGPSTVLSHEQTANRNKFYSHRALVLPVGENFDLGEAPSDPPPWMGSLEHAAPDVVYVGSRLNPAVPAFRSSEVANTLNAFHYSHVT